jgi:hypothetical protein
MKKIFFLPLLTLFAFTTLRGPMNDAERKTAIASLEETKAQVLAASKGLTEAQLKFKPAPDKWSVEDCLKHIAATEGGLRMMMDGTLKAAANPDKRADIKMTDDQLMKGIEDRSHKVKTAPMLEPQNTGFATVDDALKAFTEKRDALLEYVRTTQDDLRSHVGQSPIGAMDAYQMILMISGHSNRHVQQINEVKADPNFPK